jgi:hypothetical protein
LVGGFHPFQFCFSETVIAIATAIFTMK